MMLLSLLSYVDRNVLALLSPTILRETGLSVTQYGWMISAFSAAYLVGNPGWGRVLDRFGVRGGLLVAVTLWTLASASHAFASTVLTFALARGALGFGEGATFPGGLRTATTTLRPDQQSRGVALAYGGASLGAVLTPLLVTPIALRWGWRGAFIFTGALGLGWLALWTQVSRDPRLRPGPRGPEPTGVATGAIPRLSDPSVWGFMAVYAFGGLPLGFVLYGAPIHLGQGLGCDQAMLGHVLWVPPLGWEIGYFFWGWVVDRAARRSALDPSRSSGFFARVFGTLAILAVPLVGAGLLRSVAAVLTLLFLAMFAAAGFVIVSLAETTRRHAPGHGAYLAGLGAGSWSGLMTLAMPLFGRLLDRKEYGTAYALAAAAPALGALLWLAAAGLSARGELRPRSSA
jgi:ACS family hexuronate transporter-like MFS transporter